MRFRVLFPLLAAVPAISPAQTPPPADPDILRIVSDVSTERIQRSIYVLCSFRTRHTLSDPLPSGDGIGGAGAWIRAEFQRVSAASGGRLQVDTDTFTQHPVMPGLPRPADIENVVATLPGTQPESAGRIYVVSGHYDSRVKNLLDSDSPAPGADDDASGVAAVLEMARAMAGHDFASTIVFMAVSGEEEGLLGSAHWAAMARRRNLDIRAMLDNDIIGNSHATDGTVDRRTVRLFAQGVPPSASPGEDLLQLLRSGGENDTPPRELARAIRDIAARYVPSMGVRIVYRADRYLRGGDHLSFLEQGYPAVRLTEPAEDYRHEHEDVRVENGVSYGDLPEYVDFAYVADVARVNAAALASMARAPGAPGGVEIETARLENDTTLRWAPNPEPNLAGYRIVWRETTSPYWEHSVDVPPNVTRRTLPGISKDNVLFGVEAFDSAGHVSPASYPRPRMTL
jgi:hypothetical protein